MKYIDFYKKRGVAPEEAFTYFMRTTRSSIATWEYYVNWEKVRMEAVKLSDELNILNGLIGSQNLKEDMLQKNREVSQHNSNISCSFSCSR